MNVKIVEHYNESDKRTELLLINFDYYDGIDFISKEICNLYDDKIISNFDGIYFKKIEMKSRQGLYYLEWHEDVGNYIYPESEEYFSFLKGKINVVIEKINSI